jgi:hypothetical protein
MITTTVNLRTKPRTPSNKPHYAWNFKNAKWYKEELDVKISDTQFHFQNDAPCKNFWKFCRVILHTAKQHICKGKTPKYKCFWSYLLKQ